MQCDRVVTGYHRGDCDCGLPPSQQRCKSGMEQSSSKPRQANRGSWKPGQSGNPHGRPRCGMALAEAIRSRIDPHQVVDLVQRHLEDEAIPIADRLQVVLPWMHSGFLRPPATIAATIETNSTSQRDWGALDIDARRALLEQIRSVPQLTGETESP